MTKLDNYFFVSVDRQTFLGFEMASNSRVTSPLRPPTAEKCTTDVSRLLFSDILKYY